MQRFINLPAKPDPPHCILCNIQSCRTRKGPSFHKKMHNCCADVSLFVNRVKTIKAVNECRVYGARVVSN